MPDRRFRPRPRWFKTIRTGGDRPPAITHSFRQPVARANSALFCNLLWVSMYKFSVCAVAWAFLMYWLLSEYTNILA